MAGRTPRSLLVAGAQGFIGSHVVAAARDMGVERIVALCADPPSWDPADERIAVTVLDAPWWQSSKAIASAARGVDAAVILHYSPPPPGGDAWEHERRVNAFGAAAIAAALADDGVRVLFASSAEVHARSRTPYGQAKLEAERLIAGAAPDAVALRIATTFGAGEPPVRAIPRFALALLTGERPVVDGAGDDVRDYIHVDDVARACVLAAGAAVRGWHAYDVGTGVGRTTLAVLAAVAEAVGVVADPLHVPPRRSEHTIVLDPTATRTDTGFVPQVDFAAGLADEVEWLRAKIGVIR